MAERQELVGVFRRVQHSIPSTSFFIGRLDEGSTIVGVAKHDVMIPGLPYRYTGRWETHVQYGRQFKFDAYCRQEPKTVEQVLSYAKRYLFPAGVGIGPAKMRRMIDHKGPELVLNWIRSCPEEVAVFTGIAQDKAMAACRILLDLESFESTRIDLLSLFGTHGFPVTLVDVAIEHLGASAVGVIKRDPFTMMVREWPGCGFQRCDAMYMQLGRSKNKIKRQLMAVFYFMLSHGEGSTWFPYPLLAQYMAEVCGGDLRPKKVIELGIRGGQLAVLRQGTQLMVGTHKSATDEWLISNHVERLTNGA